MKNNKEIDYSLYLVTDRDLIEKRSLAECVERAILGGVSIIQLREKSLTSSELYKAAVEVKKITDKYNIPLIINDRLDICLAVEAAGLHIGQEDIPASVARKILGPDTILGVSAANIEEAQKAVRDGADYLGVGAVFPTPTKIDARSVSFKKLQEIKNCVDIPVLAIGGINEKNIDKLLASVELDGICVVSAILGKNDIKIAAERLNTLIKKKKDIRGVN